MKVNQGSPAKHHCQAGSAGSAGTSDGHGSSSRALRPSSTAQKRSRSSARDGAARGGPTNTMSDLRGAPVQASSRKARTARARPSRPYRGRRSSTAAKRLSPRRCPRTPK